MLGFQPKLSTKLFELSLSNLGLEETCIKALQDRLKNCQNKIFQETEVEPRAELFEAMRSSDDANEKILRILPLIVIPEVLKDLQKTQKSEVGKQPHLPSIILDLAGVDSLQKVLSRPYPLDLKLQELLSASRKCQLRRELVISQFEAIHPELVGSLTRTSSETLQELIEKTSSPEALLLKYQLNNNKPVPERLHDLSQLWETTPETPEEPNIPRPSSWNAIIETTSKATTARPGR